MTWADILKLGVPLAIIQFLLSLWVKARVEQSIKHEYDQRLESFRFELRQREQAAMIAELLSEWVAADTKPEPDKRRLNQLSWQASLWLPAPIVKDLAKVLCRSPDSKGPKDLLVQVRQHMKGSEDVVTATDIVHFP